MELQTSAPIARVERGLVAPQPVISLSRVTKRYRHGGGGVSDLSLEVRGGEVLGLLGPNGAGKTTTIRLLLDLIRPDSGSITVLGMDPRRDGLIVRSRLGYLPGELALYERMTGEELLSYLARLRGAPKRSEITSLAARLRLDLSRQIRTLSRGNKQKVGLVQAFMGEPDLVILDEPTNGLDPLVQRTVHDLIDEVRADGRTVLLSSHVLSEVSRVADRVAIIRDGRVVSVQEIDQIRARAIHRVEVRFAQAVPHHELASLAAVRHLEVSDEVARFELTGVVDPLVKALAGHEVVELTIHEPDLEEVFLELYETPGVRGGRS